MMSRGLALLVFVSGATALAYEVVWAKALGDVLGNGGQAQAIVLATYMGGLALGARVLGGVADRVRRPLALYAAIELAVGAWALLFPAVLSGLNAGFLALAPVVPEGARAVPRLALAALALLPPVVAMGGTMPAALRHAHRLGGPLPPRLAHLYAVNALGAALGAALAGVAWLPSHGLAATSRAAGLLNLAAGAIALAVAWRTAPRAAPVADVSAPESARRTRAALAALALSGLAAMLLETGWIRLVTLVVGASTFAFTWVLVAVVLGLGLGGRWAATWRDADGLRRFGWLQLALVVSVCASLALVLRVPWLVLEVRGALVRSDEGFGAWQGVQLVVALALTLAPAVLMGAAFPAAAAVAARGDDGLGRGAGRAWAVNTAGTVLGALAGGLWVLPALGLEAVFTLALLATLGAAVVAAAATDGPGRRFAPALVGAVVVGGSLATLSGWAPVLARLAPFRAPEGAARASPSAYLRHHVEELALDSLRDDAFATVVVGHLAASPELRFLLINGKPDASTSRGDRVTQTLLGQLGPLVSARAAPRVLVVGAGIGMTAAAALAHPVERLDLVEISPAVLEATRAFADVNGNALDDPRTRVHVDDARSFLALSRERYDVVVSEPSNPWVSGVSSLFTREFFESVAARLEDDGVLVQWLHTYEMDDALARLVVRTLRAVFPYVSTWAGGPGDVLLLASRRPLELEVDALSRRLAQPPVRASLAAVGVEGVEGLLALEAAPADALARYAGDGPLNTDDLNRLEYGAPRAFFAGAVAHLPDVRRRPSQAPSLALHRWLVDHPLDAAGAGRLARALDVAARHDGGLQRAAALTWLELAPDDAEARALVSRLAREHGEPEHSVAESEVEARAARRRVEGQQRAPWWTPP